MNRIYIIEEYYKKQDKWYKTFKDTFLGSCFNLRTAKKFAQEYYNKYYDHNDITKIKCKYLSTIFII